MFCNVLPKKDSPFIWLQFSPYSGVPRKYEKTSIRTDDPKRKSKIATAIKAKKEEMKMADSETKLGGWDWVPPYLKARYGKKDNESLETYLDRWTALLRFLDSENLDSPFVVQREHGFTYIDFRTSEVKEKSGKHPARNTAIQEVKMLSLLMKEAVHRNMCRENPLEKLGLVPDDPDEKPEITAEEEAIIRAHLQTEPDWMLKSFHIANSTGLRFMTTKIHRSQVCLARDEILISKPKGGKKRAFTIPIYDSIRPDIEEFMNSSREYLWEVPRGYKTPTSVAWNKFFKKIKMPHLCYHCTRVTFITRGMRNGIPENIMCKMVNHASKLINRIYQRWTIDDVRKFAGLLSGQGAAGAKP